MRVLKPDRSLLSGLVTRRFLAGIIGVQRVADPEVDQWPPSEDRQPGRRATGQAAEERGPVAIWVPDEGHRPSATWYGHGSWPRRIWSGTGTSWASCCSAGPAAAGLGHPVVEALRPLAGRTQPPSERPPDGAGRLPECAVGGRGAARLSGEADERGSAKPTPAGPAGRAADVSRVGELTSATALAEVGDFDACQGGRVHELRRVDSLWALQRGEAITRADHQDRQQQPAPRVHAGGAQRSHQPQPRAPLKQRHDGAPADLVEMAAKAQERLYRRYWYLARRIGREKAVVPVAKGVGRLRMGDGPPDERASPAGGVGAKPVLGGRADGGRGRQQAPRNPPPSPAIANSRSLRETAR